MAFTAATEAKTGPAGTGYPNSVGAFRSSLDAELKNHNANIDQKSRDFSRFEQKKREAKKTGFFSAIVRAFKPSQRQNERKLIDRLLKEWDRDRNVAANPALSQIKQEHNVHDRDSAERTAKVSDPAAASFRERAERRAQEYAQSARSRGLLNRAQDFVRANPEAKENSSLGDARLPGFVTDLTSPYQIPVGIAVAILMLALLTSLFVPGTVVTGVLASNGIVVPLGTDSDSLLFEFSAPIDTSISKDIDAVDTRNFEALKLSDYEVQPGDTLSAIATKFNLNIDTIISINAISDPKRIRVGTPYKIANRDGLMYKVVRGDSLQSIADKYKVSLTAMLDANGMADETVETGSSIFVPGARMNTTDLKMLLGELFMWPGPQYMSARFGYQPDPFTGLRHFHNGIDLPAYIGYPVKAALGGRVVLVQNQVGNYGKVIMIQHDRGLKTLYGHLDSFNVDVGQYVNQGQVIAKMGNTGRSTGPHVHFSVFLNGVAVNPLRYLK